MSLGAGIGIVVFLTGVLVFIMLAPWLATL